MFKRIISAILVSLLLALISSCNEDPASIGVELDTLQFYAIDSQTLPLIESHDNYILGFSGFQSFGRYFIGKYEDTESIAVIRFGADSTLAGAVPSALAGMDGSKIISAKLMLQPRRYCFGDSVGGNFNIEIKELQKPLFSTTRWDSIDGNNYFKDEVKGSYNQKIQLMDTMPEISIDLDKSLLLKWFDDAKAKDSSFYNYAIGLIPTANANIIHQFSDEGISSTAEFKGVKPYIQMIYNNDIGGIDTLKMISRLVAGYTHAKPDTTDGFIYIQAGVPIRSKINFNLENIPQFASIVSTRLELTLDRSKSIAGNQGLDSTIVGADLKVITDDLRILNFAAYSDYGTNKFIFPSITSAAEIWNRNNGKGSFSLIPVRDTRLSSEVYYLERWAFHGVNDPDSTKRPKLYVIYSRRPKL